MEIRIPDKYIEYALANIWKATEERKANKRSKYNGYKHKPERTCFHRGTTGADRHEVFYGTGQRQISIEYGFQVDLSSELHSEIHRQSEWGKEEDMLWKQTYQTVYMDCMEADGFDREQALSAWMHLIGRNYLEDVMPE